MRNAVDALAAHPVTPWRRFDGCRLLVRGTTVQLMAAALGLGLGLLLLSRNFRETRATIAEVEVPATLRCLTLRASRSSHHSRHHRRHLLLAAVAAMPRQIEALNRAHQHDADGKWPAAAVYELGSLHRTLNEALCFARGSEVTKVHAVASSLEPLLAHAGLLGRDNRTVALGSRPSPSQSWGWSLVSTSDSPSHEHQHIDMQDVHEQGAHPAIGYAYA